MKKSLIAEESGVVMRHWDLVLATGVMLLAAGLGWVLRGMFVDAPKPPMARAPVEVATAVIGQATVVRELTPTAKERVVASAPSKTPSLRATKRIHAAEQLVDRWLSAYCRRVERDHTRRGEEQWSCSWQEVRITGTLPTVEVDFTRVERALDGDAASVELLTRDYRLLTCADRACRRLTSLSRTRRGLAATEKTAAPPGGDLESDIPRRSPNRPPSVEILAAPQWVAPGERLILRSRVTDPDSGSGDEIDCVWSVDGRAVASLCWELVWNVPTAKSYGNVVVSLEAKDRAGASDRKSVSIFVGPADD